MAKWVEFGENVREVGVVFVFDVDLQSENARRCCMYKKQRTFLNSYKSVELLYSHIPLDFGGSKGSLGCQYSRKPVWSAETTVS